jgi:hypothetical protein
LAGASYLTIQHTTEFVATSEETIQKIATDLAGSGRKFRVFKAIYSGGGKPKDAALLAKRTHLIEMVVLQLATPMAHQQYCERVKYKGRIAFKKHQHINAVRHSIFRLAKNRKLLAKHVSARTPKQTISVRVKSRERTEIKIREVFIDDIDEFRRARTLKAAKLQPLTPLRLPEKVFKYGVASILGNKGKFTDWGGERNDLYTSHIIIDGHRRSTAFGFKGPATPPPLTPRKLGKNGDQIPRLFSSTAEVFFVQFEGKIEESVKELMLTHAIRKSHETRHEILYGIIAFEDSHRLRTKYSAHFTSANVPSKNA